MRNHLGRPRLHGLLLALALAASLPAQDPPTATSGPGSSPELPSESVSQRRSAGGGASSPIFGVGQSGEAGFYKPDLPVRRLSSYGNMEGELLSSRMLEQLGFRTPRSRLVKVRPRYWDGTFRERVYLQAEVVEGTPQAPLLELGAMQVGELRMLDTAQVRRLALVDIVIGNGDRHKGNLLFQRVEGGRFEPIPIDHNFAFAGKEVVPHSYWQRNFLPGLKGVELGPGVHDARVAMHAADAGSIDLILHRNHLYQELTFGALVDAEQREALLKEAAKLKAQITDGMIEAEVSRLSDAEIGAKDPVARRQELIEVMKQRRDQLPTELARYLEDTMIRFQRESIAVAPLPEVVPPEMWKRLQLTEGAKVRLANALCGPRMPPAEVYLALRLEGLDPLTAKEVAFTALRRRGVEFSAQFPTHVERALREQGYLDHQARRGGARPNTALAGRGPGDAPFEARIGAERNQLVDARGGALPAEHVAAAEPVVEALRRQVPLEAGDRVQVRRRGFVEAGNGAVYEAQVIDGRGRVKGTAEVRLPLAGEATATWRSLEPQGPTGRPPPTASPATEPPVERAHLQEIHRRLQERAARKVAEGKVSQAQELVRAAAQVDRLMESAEPVTRADLSKIPEVRRTLEPGAGAGRGPGGTLREGTVRERSTGSGRYKPNSSKVRFRHLRGRRG